MTHAPCPGSLMNAGKESRNLSEDERAERAEAEEEERQTVQQKNSRSKGRRSKIRFTKLNKPRKSWGIHDLGKDHNIPSDEGYLYHATNHDRARDIAESGLDTHKTFLWNRPRGLARWEHGQEKLFHGRKSGSRLAVLS